MDTPLAERLRRRGPFPVAFRRLEVVRVESLGPRLRRVVLGGDELAGFRSEGADDHVKLAFPNTEGALALPFLGSSGLVWPEGVERSPMRDYTPRAFDAVRGELSIDFVLHGDGPAASWAARCAPGSPVGVAGPRGSLEVDAGFDGYLLLGDQTALPAIARRLEEAPADLPIIAAVEVIDGADEIALPTKARLAMSWLHRRSNDVSQPSLLARFAEIASLPPGDIFVWAAAESAVSRSIRDVLLARGVPKEHMRISGYWKRGVEAHHD